MFGNGFAGNSEEGKTCTLCKKNYVETDDICRYCKVEVDEAFFRIKDYLYKHPNADAVEISEELVLDQRIVLFLIDNKRLEMVKKGVSQCTMCGKAVIGNRLCTECREKIGKRLGQARQSLLDRGAVEPSGKPTPLAGQLQGKLHVDPRRRR